MEQFPYHGLLLWLIVYPTQSSKLGDASSENFWFSFDQTIEHLLVEYIGIVEEGLDGNRHRICDNSAVTVDSQSIK